MKSYNEVAQDELNQGKKILVFSGEWCVDCVVLKSYIDQVVEENPDWEFILVDTDTNQDVAQQNEIFGIPSFVAYDNGKRIGDLISKDAKPKSLINSWIKTLGIL